MPVGSRTAAMRNRGVVALSKRASRFDTIARTNATTPEPSVTTTRAVEFMPLHWVAMKTPRPAKTNVPPRYPST
jgi:hypothetical protein